MARRFKLGTAEVNPDVLEIITPGRTIRVEAKAMDVLCHLAKQAPNTVTSDELLDAVWGTIIVGDNTIHRLIALLRKALGDKARQPTYIETIKRRGYRLLKTPTYPDETESLTTVQLVYKEADAVVAKALSTRLIKNNVGVSNPFNAAMPESQWTEQTSESLAASQTIVFFPSAWTEESSGAINYVLTHHKHAIVINTENHPVPLSLRRFPIFSDVVESFSSLLTLIDLKPDNTKALIPSYQNERPSVVVLPFEVANNRDGQMELGDGLLTDIVYNLSMNRDFFVIGSGTSLSYRNQSTSMPRIAKELQVRYAVIGRLQQANDKIRLHIELCAAESSRVLWSERFESNSQDLFKLQDEISTSVAVQLQPRVTRAEVRRSAIAQPQNLTAWELYHKSRSYGWSQSWLKQSINDLTLAIEADPKLASAHALLSARLAYLMWYGELQHYERAIGHLKTAVELAPADPFVHVACVIFYAHTGEPEKSLDAAIKALELNPNIAEAWAYYGFCLGMAGKGAEGLQQLEIAFSLSPKDPLKYLWHFFNIICFVDADDYESALIHARHSLALRNDWFLVHMFEAVVLAVLGGNDDEAHAAWQRAKTNNPEVSHSGVKFWLTSSSLNQEQQNRQLDALTRCGCD